MTTRRSALGARRLTTLSRSALSFCLIRKTKPKSALRARSSIVWSLRNYVGELTLSPASSNLFGIRSVKVLSFSEFLTGHRKHLDTLVEEKRRWWRRNVQVGMCLFDNLAGTRTSRTFVAGVESLHGCSGGSFLATMRASPPALCWSSVRFFFEKILFRTGT